MKDVTIEQYIHGMKSTRTYQGADVYNIFGYAYTSKDGIIFNQISTGSNFKFDGYKRVDLLPRLILLNGEDLIIDGDILDESTGNPFDIPSEFLKLPVASLLCLAKLCNIVSSKKQKLEAEHLTKLANTVRLIDFTPQTLTELSEKERRTGRLKQQKGEHTLVYSYNFRRARRMWHKPSTCLFLCNNKRFILGRDEATYFGCELPSSCCAVSVKEAFEDLKPDEVIGKRGVLRQGEWFAIPVAARSVPKIGDKRVITNDRINLPVEDASSNIHELNGSHYHDIRILDNKIYARNWNLEHNQHDTLHSVSGVWYTFARNTAVRSVSQEGVD